MTCLKQGHELFTANSKNQIVLVLGISTYSCNGNSHAVGGMTEAPWPMSACYGWSAFGSQGVTVERALVLADANFDRHLAYVTASRARAQTHLFVDSASVDAVEMDLSSLGPLSEEAERLVKLSRRMARKNTKRSTLDYLPPADWDRWRIAPPAHTVPYPDAPLERFAEMEFDCV